MIDRESFIQKILANTDAPDFDEHGNASGPRLVFADWLEEQGEGDRAEFIRLQCSPLLRKPHATHPAIPCARKEYFVAIF